ncbi:hypothetical protein JCGZ_01514 [Jatropha curcas]|uniref:Uncharacterized protein n=1 Tax=Jatropha curcas TaxID=180498 RepID=A0A067LKY8_JATCU|nr:uncharacterized protein LOC105648143 [Jatropha curcas]KDP45014.1 hypothetical protein JCGZ_01514 [Jatropha curcas]
MSNSHPPDLPPKSKLRQLSEQRWSCSLDIEKDTNNHNHVSISDQIDGVPISNSQLQPPQLRFRRLFKQRSWSPDTEKEEVWLRRKSNSRMCNKGSLTDEDLEELKASFELGFGFKPDSPDLDPKLSDALPALRFYCAVNKEYTNSLLRSSSSSSILSDSDSSSTCSSSILDSGDDSETVKMKLKQWARVVAYSVRQVSGKPN